MSQRSATVGRDESVKSLNLKADVESESTLDVRKEAFVEQHGLPADSDGDQKLPGSQRSTGITRDESLKSPNQKIEIPEPEDQKIVEIPEPEDQNAESEPLDVRKEPLVEQLDLTGVKIPDEDEKKEISEALSASSSSTTSESGSFEPEKEEPPQDGGQSHESSVRTIESVPEEVEMGVEEEIEASSLKLDLNREENVGSGLEKEKVESLKIDVETV